jgi:hypothetical protein
MFDTRNVIAETLSIIGAMSRSVRRMFCAEGALCQNLQRRRATELKTRDLLEKSHRSEIASKTN